MPRHGLIIALGMGPKRDSEAPPKRPYEESTPAMDQMESEEKAEGEAGIPPDAVSYHTGDQKCESCEYMMDDGQCSKLKMPVGPTDWCRLFEPRNEGMEHGMEHGVSGIDEVPA